jgi:putative membrane protein
MLTWIAPFLLRQYLLPALRSTIFLRKNVMECTAMMDGMGMMLWMFFSFLFGLLVLVLVVLGAVHLGRRMWGQRSESTEGRESALDILKKRYARGELSREEFERVKKEIE